MNSSTTPVIQDGNLGIENIQNLFDALKATAILGWYIAHDGLQIDDAFRLISSIPEISAIATKVQQAPLALAELRELSLSELAELNIYQATMFKDIITAIAKINETGAYKSLRRVA